MQGKLASVVGLAALVLWGVLPYAPAGTPENKIQHGQAGPPRPAAAGSGQVLVPQKQEKKTMSMKKLTPVLVVEEVEPCVKWWVERMGFEKTVEVPEGNKLGFVILVKDGVEIMYQSRVSVEKDVPGMLQGGLRATTGLFIEVTDIEDVIRRMKGAEIAVPRRKTFYGADEIGVREPGGSVVIFAQFAQNP